MTGGAGRPHLCAAPVPHLHLSSAANSHYPSTPFQDRMASSWDSLGYSFARNYLGEDFDLCCKSSPLYKQPHAYLQTHSIQAFSPLHSKSSLILQDPTTEKEIVIVGVDFNKNPLKEDVLAIVPIEEALPLTVVHPKEVVYVPPKKTYGQSYYAQAR
jgi:hypothetical protein